MSPLCSRYGFYTKLTADIDAEHNKADKKLVRYELVWADVSSAAEVQQFPAAAFRPLQEVTETLTSCHIGFQFIQKYSCVSRN